MGGVGRKKRQKRAMTFYRLAFGLEPPFHVVLHPDFIVECVKARVNIKDQLPKVMQDRAYPVVTRCIVEYLKRTDFSLGTAVLARQFMHVPCRHNKVKALAKDDSKDGKQEKEEKDKEEEDGGEEEEEEEEEEAEAQQEARHKRKNSRWNLVQPGTCIRALLDHRAGKGMSVAVAGDTKDDLRRKELPAVPFLLFVPPTSIMVLPPCTDAQKKAKREDEKKMRVTTWERRKISAAQEKIPSLPARVHLGKRKREKQANPLSCKKRKTEQTEEKKPAGETPKKKKKNRRKKRKPKAAAQAEP